MAGGQIDWEALLAAARRAAKEAYCPYSGLAIGAAVLGANSQIYAGCNVENASYGLTMCAERVAMGNATADGARPFQALVIVGQDEGPTSPCGACRQVLIELAPDASVLLAGRLRSHRLDARDLLPGPFTASDLPVKS